jgi:RNA polymerase sigma factor (sigma-70 family)
MASCAYPPDNAARARMVESVTPLVHKLVRESGIPAQERDDARQECLLAVWKATARFDTARGVKWVTYAGSAVRGILADLFRRFDAGHRLPVGAIGDADPIDPASTADDADGPDGIESVGSEAAGALAAIAGPLVADLTPNERRLFALFAVEGLTAPQVADQLGRKLSVVEIAIRGIVRKLLAGGNLPADLVAKFADWKRLDALCPARRVIERRPGGRTRRRSGAAG